MLANDRQHQQTKQLIQSQQSRARRHLFLAERAAFRIPRTPVAPPKVESVGVIGAGTMGAGIAIAFLFAGLRVVLVDAKQVSPPAAERKEGEGGGWGGEGREHAFVSLTWRSAVEQQSCYPPLKRGRHARVS